MKTREKITTRDISLLYVGRVRSDWSDADARDISLPDGNPNAVRVRVDAESGAAVECRGRIGICAPWLMAKAFSA